MRYKKIKNTKFQDEKLIRLKIYNNDKITLLAEIKYFTGNRKKGAKIIIAA